jgi:diguanylate cyclase (GGDEF)-like protein/PAS domain S-box-containing protein
MTSRVAGPDGVGSAGGSRAPAARDSTRDVLDTAHEAFISIDGDDRVTIWNTEAERLFGWSREEATGRRLEDLIIPSQYREAHRQGLKRFLATGTGSAVNQRLELSALRRDGMEFPIEMTISAVRVGDGWAFNAFLHDITERKRAEQYREAQLALSSVLAEANNLHEAESVLLQTLAEAMDWKLGVLWLVDERGEKLVCSQAWHGDQKAYGAFLAATQAAGFERSVGLPGRTWELGAPQCLEDVQQDDNFPRIAAALKEGLHGAIAFPVECAGQFIGVFEFFGEALHPLDSQLFGVLDGFRTQIGQFVERTRAEQQLAHQAVHDSLTGLPNRTLLLDRLSHALGRLSRTSESVAVLFCDVDDFKAINDSFGHVMGDQLLIAIAERLKGVLRASDTAARFGGDEYVVLCEELTGADQALEVAQRVINEVSAPFVLAGQEVRSSISIGIAMASEPHTSRDMIIRQADAAMYQSKQLGGGRFELSDNSLGREAFSRLHAKEELRHAVADQQFALLYQPQVSLETGGLIGVEALVRWNHPSRGLLPPSEFIPLAETTGLIVPLGRWVMHEAFRQARRWHLAFPRQKPLSVSINLSARQFREHDLASMVDELLEETRVDPDRICFELTETSFMEDLEGALETLEALRSLGTHVAIDDFGVGFSSLNYLKQLTAVETVKVDRSFTNNLLVDPRDHAIIDAQLTLARAMNLGAVVEGVETREQATELRALGCEFAQGYLFAKPERPAFIDELLDTEHATFDVSHAPAATGRGHAGSITPPGSAVR